MNDEIKRILDQHEKDIRLFNTQRKFWLYASIVALCGISFLIFEWDWLSNLNSHSLWWTIIGVMLIISINWWYWTMKFIRIVIKYQSIEYDLLKSILYDIHSVKIEIQEAHRILDKIK